MELIIAERYRDAKKRHSEAAAGLYRGVGRENWSRSALSETRSWMIASRNSCVPCRSAAAVFIGGWCYSRQLICWALPSKA